ncbi:hypothetical protein SAMN04487972_104166 [Paracoccus halophilus]|uniref:Uncharacterized protein n=1 Tax=Paracoccus halophilus TaxID=376733 RepID=A0A1I0T349_9RHOB|nr:hypothetical protein [Paracoccus halophilus]SFA46140.1 hypothetical protein SAMN04487972_104166 [Paracoccus halophilus]
MSRKPTSPIALAALLSMLAVAPVMAQDTVPAPAESQAEPMPAQDAGPSVTLPQALQDAGLTDVTSRPMHRGNATRIEGALPDGSRIGALIDETGALRGLRGLDDAALPAALSDQLVPQAVRDNPVYAELAQLRSVFVGERGVRLAGSDAENNPLHASFTEDGTLIRFGRGDDDERKMGEKRRKDAEKQRKEADKRRDRDDRWHRDARDRHRDRDGDRDHRGRDRMRERMDDADRRPMPDAPQPDAPAN